MIRLQNVSKDYIGFRGPLDRILSGISFGYLGGRERFSALKDISFECRASEIVGIIGRNGAGKSTLLKIIAGVSQYNRGTMEITGKVRAILELGVGFNPELSGEENVYYNGLLWGYSANEIDLILDDVFEFASLEEFRSTPIKNYSSGMIMRLGFALATATPPEVLIVDEALAVGDAGFQQKCLKRFHEFRKKGTTTLIVSHDLSLLGQLCSRILVLEKGRLVFDGEAQGAIRYYMKLIGSQLDSLQEINLKPISVFQNWSWTICRGEERMPKLLFVGEEVFLIVQFVPKIMIPQLTIGFHLDDSRGVRAFGTNTYQLGYELRDLEPNRVHTVRFRIPLYLGVGKYSLGLSLHEGDSHSSLCYYWEEGLYSFEVERVSIPKFVGIAYLPVQMEYSVSDTESSGIDST